MSSVDPEVMKLGKESYMICSACHGVNGEGMPNIGPPLVGSEWVLGPSENLIRMQFRGLQGPITVKGEEWNLAMAPNAPILQTDDKIAAVITYIRNSWGNEASAVSSKEVAAHRAEVGQPMLTVLDLVDPLGDKDESKIEKSADKAQANMGQPEGVPIKLENYPQGMSIGGIGLGIWIAVCLIPVLIGLAFKNSE